MNPVTYTGAFRNYFGGIFRAALGITPRGNYQTQFLGNKTPVFVDIENLLDVYFSCPYLQLVISKKAEMLSNGRICVRNIKTKEEIKNDPLLALIKNPNPLQNRKQLITQYSIYNDIFANTFFYKNKPFKTSQPKTIWNLPPNYMKIVPTGKLFDQYELSGIIEKYQFIVYGQVEGITGFSKDYSVDEVNHFSEGIGQSVILSKSKFIPLQANISNIIGALKTRNIFIYHGPKMLISSAQKDNSGGGVPLNPASRKLIEEQTTKQHYGINDSQSHIIITDAALTLDKMSYPTKDLMLFEEIEDDFAAICGSYGIGRDLFATQGSNQNGTMQAEAIKRTYQDTIIPAGETLCEILNVIFETEKQGKEFYMDFSHVAALQEDAQKKATAALTSTQRNEILLSNGVISHDAWAEMEDIDMTGDKIIQSKQPKIVANGN